MEIEIEDEDEDENEDEEPRRRPKCKKSRGGGYHEEKKMKKMEIKKMKCDYDDLECKKMKIEKKEEKVEFSNKDLILTQDIFDGCWNLNPQTKILIEKNTKIYEKIAIQKEKILIYLNIFKYRYSSRNIRLL